MTKRLYAILLTLGFASCLYAVKVSQSTFGPGQPILKSRLFPKGLTRNYEIWLGDMASQFPIGTALCLVKNKRTTRLRSPSELQGLFHIDNASEALSFLRIFSNQDTWAVFERGAAEVVSARQITGDYMLGNTKSALPRLSKQNSRINYGVLTGEDFKKLGKPPKVVKGSGGFIVSRVLVTPWNKSGVSHLVRRTEFVGTTGSYRLIDEVAVKTPPTIFVILPTEH